MNINKKFLLVFFAFMGTINSQTIDPKLITFPVSPEAGRLGTYGNVPVSLYSGLLKKSVELFDGQVGDYAIPVNLSYNYSGFRVEESPSIVGLGWQLGLGGVVTREVRGLPDEHPYGYYGNDYVRENVLDVYFNNGTISSLDAKKVAGGEYDSEVDTYRLSVNGISFSFKIGLDGNPCFLSKHNYKLQINRDPSYPLKIMSFVLTDTNSNQYTFNQTETNVGVFGNTNIYDDNFPNYISSWQLSQITLNNQSVITFDYQDDIYYSYNYYAVGVYRPQGPNIPATSYNYGATKDQINRKILKSIECDFFKVSFNIATINNQKVYDKITIADHNENIISEYDFLYTGTRNLLDRINKNGTFFYDFDYFGSPSTFQPFMNSTSSFPWNQDDWGYANGAQNQYGVSMPNTTYTSDKNPSFNTTLDGALKKIKYPTGGYTEFVYEQNTIEPGNLAYSDPAPNVRLQLKFKSDNLPSAPISKEKYYTKTFTTDVVATLSTTIESYVQAYIELMINKLPESGISPAPTETSVPEQFYNKIPYLRGLSGNPIPQTIPKLYDVLNDGYTTDSYTLTRTSDGKFIIPAGTYEFRFRAVDNRKKSFAAVTLDYYDEAVADTTNVLANRTVGGLRVKQTIDYPEIGNPVIKNYDYSDDEGTSLGSLFGKLTKRVDYDEVYVIAAGTGYASYTTYAVEYNAKSYSVMGNEGTPVAYSGVKEYTLRDEVFVAKKLLHITGGDLGSNYDLSSQFFYLGGAYGSTKTAYPNGFITKEFTGSNRYPSNQYPFPPQGDDLSSGAELSSSVYGKTKTNYSQDLLVKDSNTYYFSNSSNWATVYSNPNYPKSLKMGYSTKIFGIQATELTVNQLYLFNVYKEFDSKSYLWKTNNSEYINNQLVEKNSVFEYNAFDQQKKVTTTTGTEEVSKEIFYPTDFNDAISLDMVLKNCTSPIVKIVDKKDGAIIQTTQFEYGSIGTNLFKPNYFLQSKGSNPLLKKIYYGYDSKGNLTANRKILVNPPTQATSAIEPTTHIIWGYNKSQPIAKIENPIVLGIPAATITDLQNKSNADNDHCASGNCNEAILRQALNALRTAYPTAMITTYTHDPLIGVTSITDPKGDMITYEYDEQHRLKAVRDKDGNILSDNQYHYKTQN